MNKLRFAHIVAVSVVLMSLITAAAEGQLRGHRHRRTAVDSVALAINLYTRPLIRKMDPRVQRALERIQPAPRRLLAIRYYLVRADDVDSLWAWSRAEARVFKSSDEFARLKSAIKAIADTFATRNPGYGLRIPVHQRSLARQLQNWNSVRSVRLAADTLWRYCRSLFADSLLPLIPDSVAQRNFDSLFFFAPDPIEPTVALPGLSQHGQLRAFDFKIVTKRGRLVAGAASNAIENVWEKRGWTVALNESVNAAAPGLFAGPLQKPYEPWHYTWVGAADKRQSEFDDVRPDASREN